MAFIGRALTSVHRPPRPCSVPARTLTTHTRLIEGKPWAVCTLSTRRAMRSHGYSMLTVLTTSAFACMLGWWLPQAGRMAEDRAHCWRMVRSSSGLERQLSSARAEAAELREALAAAGVESGRLRESLRAAEFATSAPAGELTPAQRQMTVASWRAARDEDTIHIVQVICAAHVPPHDTGFDSFTSIKSILLARAVGPSRRRRYHFHVIGDKRLRDLIAMPAEHCPPKQGCPLQSEMIDVLDYIRNGTDGRVALTFYDADADVVGPAEAAESARGNAGVLSIAGFKLCSSVRLRLPWVGGALGAARRVLLLDRDTSIKCDLEEVFDAGVGPALGESGDRKSAFLALAEESPHEFYPSVYRHADPPEDDGVKFPSAYKSGANAGVILAQMDTWRSVRNEYATLLADIVRTDGYSRYNLSLNLDRSQKTGGGLTYYDQVCCCLAGWGGGCKCILSCWRPLERFVGHRCFLQSCHSHSPPSLTRTHKHSNIQSHTRTRRTFSTSCLTGIQTGLHCCLATSTTASLACRRAKHGTTRSSARSASATRTPQPASSILLQMAPGRRPNTPSRAPSSTTTCGTGGFTRRGSCSTGHLVMPLARRMARWRHS